MIKTNLLQISILCVLFIAFACKKEVEPDSPNCQDNIMNNGELGVDCGGPCAPCQFPAVPFLFAAFNAEMANFFNISSSYGDTIHIVASNDSIQLNLRFKNLLVPDQNGELWPLILDGSPFVTFNDVSYSQVDLNQSVVIVTDIEDYKFSGLFQLYLPYGVNNLDTLKVANGSFLNLPY